MHIHFEKSINGECDCTILSMSWMGKVPDELPEDEGWKLNRTHYYQEGWLATGNIRGILGVTFTTSHWRKNSSEMPHRTNYNLRGHRAQITLVQWNEPYQKLASCDSSGIIFVWIKYEGRWSIELINDRSTPVTHFSWSHDGRMALICYQDGFVLVGSVAGQRYWSSMLNLEATIMCGIWTPDDQHVYFGTSNAQVIVMDVHGVMVSQVQLPVDSSIRAMAWSCEKFKMEENEDGEPSSGSHFSNRREPFLLAIAFKNGLIYLMKNYDDISPIHIWTGMQGLLMEWSNSGEYLAVAGSRPVEVINEAGFRVHEYFNSIYFYNHRGVRVLNIVIPSTSSPVTALTWGHNDKRLFVATGKIIHVGWVSKRVASLQLICRLAIYKSLPNKSCVAHLPLPLPVRALISSLHTQTIVSILPNPEDLREFVSHPPSGNLRLHCTMIRHEEDANQSPGTAYTLYLEYLGGLVPILKGKRTSKIRPEFVIFDPQSEGANFGILVRSGEKSGRHAPDVMTTILNGRSSPARLGSDLAHSLMAFSDSSESEDVELCASPHMQRRRYRNRLRERERERERERQRERERDWERIRNGGQPVIPDPTTLVNPQQLVYNDVLPESLRLVAVTSNIWGTKFKIHGLAMSLPENLGSVTYKTSLLHLQPRQMTLVITELRDDIFLSSDAGMRSSHFRDDDEEDFSVVVTNSTDEGNSVPNCQIDPFRVTQAPTCLVSSSPCSGTASVSHDLVSTGGLSRRHCDSRVLPPQKRFVQEKQMECESCHGSASQCCSSGPPAPIATCEEVECSQADVGFLDGECRRTDLKDRELVQLKEALQCLRNGGNSGEVSKRGLSYKGVKAETIVTQVQVETSVENSTSSNSSPSCSKFNASSEQGPSNASVSYQQQHHQQNNRPTSTTSPNRNSWVQNDPTDVNAKPSFINIRPASGTPPIHVRRSLSASLLDSVDMVTQLTLDVVSQDLRDSQPRRLVLVKSTKVKDPLRHSNGKPLLKEWGKSKSWDSYDLSAWKKVQPHKPAVTIGDSTCPKCSYPSASKGESKREALIIGATATPRPSRCSRFLAEQHGTPKRRPGASNPAVTSLIPRRIPTKRKERAQNLPSEDAIESMGNDQVELCSPAMVNLTVPPVSGPAQATSAAASTPSTPTPAHRRSMSLLTPLLKRREQAKGHPKSSSFIPPGSPQHLARSSPSTPATARKSKASSYLSTASSPFRQLFANSPLLSRRRRQSSSSTQDHHLLNTPKQGRKHWNRETQTGASNCLLLDSSDEEVTEEINIPPNSSNRFSRFAAIDGQSYGLTRPPKTPGHGLSRAGNTFTHPGAESNSSCSTSGSQRSHLRQKLSKKKIHNIENSPVIPRRMEFVMHNKAPMWNENSQVYQLDFGGRVTQESAKNFQIEFRNKQVMQFGRIDGNAYTMDFQYPFSALQAFAVALANVTQRLK